MAGAICRNLEQSSVLIFHVIMAQLKTFTRPNFFPKKVAETFVATNKEPKILGLSRKKPLKWKKLTGQKVE